jgi:hypothetical protein
MWATRRGSVPPYYWRAKNPTLGAIVEFNTSQPTNDGALLPIVAIGSHWRSRSIYPVSWDYLTPIKGRSNDVLYVQVSYACVQSTINSLWARPLATGHRSEIVDTMQAYVHSLRPVTNANTMYYATYSFSTTGVASALELNKSSQFLIPREAKGTVRHCA